MKHINKNPEPIVVLKNVGRSFHNHAVLSDVSLKIYGGEMVGIVGPNGGGKSTLLFLMAGLLQPTKGDVTVCGIKAYTLSLMAAGSVGLVTARPGLYPLLTGRENLWHFGGLFGWSPQEVDQKSASLLKTFQLTNSIDKRVGHMSTGMQQKLSLLRALLTAPQLFLLDEPTANLDPLMSHALYKEVRKQADNGLACVLATHDLSAVESVCDRVFIIDGCIKKKVTFVQRRIPVSGPLLKAWQESYGG